MDDPLMYSVVLVSYFSVAVVLLYVIIYFIRCAYKIKYQGKPLSLETNLHIKFVEIIQDNNGKIIFSAHPIFMGRKRSLRYFLVEKYYLKNPITISQSLSTDTHYIVKNDDNKKIYFEKIEAIRKSDYYK